MEAWRRKKGLLRSGVKFTTRFDPLERELIGNLTATVAEALIGRAQSAPKDEFAEMMGTCRWSMRYLAPLVGLR